MKHQRQRVKNKILGRKRSAYTALRRDLAQNLILYEKITTTRAKASVLRPFIERLIHKAKTQNLAARRAMQRHFTNDLAIKKIMEKIGPKYKERHGGYVRIVKMTPRQGDNAPLVRVEFV